MVAWVVAEVESAEIEADLVQRACLKKRYRRPSGFGSNQCNQPPQILHADNGNTIRGATLESRLEEMGLLLSFSRPRVSNDNPYSESQFRTIKYRPDYLSRPFGSKGEACAWVVAFVDCYNHRHRHSCIIFVTPHQRHCGQAAEICQRRTEVYDQAGPSAASPSMEPIHPLLAPTGSGPDQQTHERRNPSKGVTFDSGSLNKPPRDVIFPESYRLSIGCFISGRENSSVRCSSVLILKVRSNFYIRMLPGTVMPTAPRINGSIGSLLRSIQLVSNP